MSIHAVDPEISYHETRFTYDKRRAIVWTEIIRYLQKKVPFGETVLDVGCGYGEFINHVPSPHRFAVDQNPAMKQYLDENVSFAASDALQIRQLFAQNSFDFIFCSNLLEHLERDEIGALLKIFASLVKPGGHVGIMMPNYSRAPHQYFDDYTHKTPLSDVALSDWLSAVGLEPVLVDPAFMPFSLKGSRLPVSRLLVRAWLLSPFRPWGRQMLVIARRPHLSKRSHVAE